MIAHILSVAIIIFATSLCALPHNKRIGIVHLFGDKVNVRQKPDPNSSILETIAIAKTVTVEKKTSILYDSGGLIDYWYQVKTESGKIGYIWGALLADYATSFDIDGDTEAELILVRNFTSGLYSTTIDESGHSLISKSNNGEDDKLLMRVVKNGKILFSSRELTRIGEMGIQTIESFVVEGLEEKPVQFIRFEFGFSGETFGKGEQLLIFSHGVLRSVFMVEGSSEGGFESQYSMECPRDPRGKAGQLTIIYKYKEYVDEGKTRDTSETKIYRWDPLKQVFTCDSCK